MLGPEPVVRSKLVTLSGITTLEAAGAELVVAEIAPATCNLVVGVLVPIPTFCWAKRDTVALARSAASNIFFMSEFSKFLPNYNNSPILTGGRELWGNKLNDA